MATNYVQDGVVIQHTAGSAYSAGDVVELGQSIGVALEDIASGAVGPVQISGVFNLAKVSTAVITQGEEVIWDTSASAFDDNAATPATGDISDCCVAMETAGNGVTTVAVKLNVGIGTVA